MPIYGTEQTRFDALSTLVNKTARVVANAWPAAGVAEAALESAVAALAAQTPGNGEAEVGESGTVTSEAATALALPVVVTIDGEAISSSYCAQFSKSPPSVGHSYTVVDESTITDTLFDGTAYTNIKDKVAAVLNAVADPSFTEEDIQQAMWVFTDDFPIGALGPNPQLIANRVLDGTYQPILTLWSQPATASDQVLVAPDPSPPSAATGSITIIKDASPDDAQDFSFTATNVTTTNFSLDNDADPTLSNQQLFSSLADGSYTFTEAATTGWDLTNIVCTGNSASTITMGGDATFNAGDTDVAITLSGAENITCTFTNIQQSLPVLIGNRVWIEDDNDGDATTGTITPVVGTTVTATASDGTTYTDVTDASGNYAISVPADAVYTVTVGTPAGTTPAGTLITTDSDPTTQDDLSHDGSGTIVTVGTVDNLTIDFGFYEASPPPPCGTDPDDLGGTIWRDYNSNGVQDATELGFDGVTVTAYDNDGNGVATTVNPDGTYTFSDIFATETHIRLEFSGLPDWAESGMQGTNSGTTVQRHSAATCDADLAVQNPADYCQSNPEVGTSCYIAGDQSTNVDALVSLNYDRTGSVNHLVNAPNIGATWGFEQRDGCQPLSGNRSGLLRCRIPTVCY